MDAPALQEFGSLRPAIKQRWDGLLRALPSPSPLTHPDLMVFMMDDILDRLTESLREASPADEEAATIGHLRQRCPCGLNPLLPCYLTGEQALIEAVAPRFSRELPLILTRYQRLARHDIEAICGVCQLRDTPAAPLAASGG